MYKSKSLKETENIAKIILKNIISLDKKKKKEATVLVCSGNLGSGKTTFVKKLAKVLGIKKGITSPTFVLEKIYSLSKKVEKNFGFSRLVHIDAYRIEKINELKPLRFKELSMDPQNLIVIEWGEKIKKALPKSYKKLKFLYVDEKTRHIKFLNSSR